MLKALRNFKLYIFFLPGKVSFLYTLLMVDFDFVRQECPSISFFFARLGVYLEYSFGQRTQAGLFMSHFSTFKPIFPFIL